MRLSLTIRPSASCWRVVWNSIDQRPPQSITSPCASGSAAAAIQSTCSGVRAGIDEPTAERGDAGPGVELDAQRHLDAGHRVGERDDLRIALGARLDEGELGDEAAVVAMQRQRRVAGEAAAGLGEEVERLAAVERPAAAGAGAQRLHRRRIDILGQRRAPVGERRRPHADRKQHRLAAAVQPQQGSAARHPRQIGESRGRAPHPKPSSATIPQGLPPKVAAVLGAGRKLPRAD